MPKRKAKARPRYAEQPAVAAILKILRRPRGATAAEIAKARGLQPHSVRSVLSRLGSKAGLMLTRTKVEGRGGLVYRVRLKASAP
jgi:predicted ArsR family transcriptional regulator